MSALRGSERDALHRHAVAHVRPSALARDEAARFDRTLWRQLAAAGMFAGAEAGDLPAAARAVAGLVHGGRDVPLALSAVAQWIGIHLVARFGGDAQRAHLPALVAGDAIVAVCNAEPHAGTDLRGMRSRVDADGRGGQLATLHKSSASNLGDADLALVSAWHHRDGREPALVVLLLPTRAAPIVQTSHVERLAGFRTGLTGALETSAPLPVGPDDLLGDDGLRVLRRCFDLERLLIGALLHGAAEALLDLAVDHLRAREADDPQFTRHQYVQDKLAGVAACARRSEALVALALTGPELAADGELLSTIKLENTDAALAAAALTCELHGYQGYVRAGFPHKLRRDLEAFGNLGGTRELMKITLFRSLRARWAP